MATDAQAAQVVVEVTQSRTQATAAVAQVVVEVTRQRIAVVVGNKLLVGGCS